MCSCCTLLNTASNIPNMSPGSTTTYSRIWSSVRKSSNGSVDVASELKYQLEDGDEMVSGDVMTVIFYGCDYC